MANIVYILNNVMMPSCTKIGKTSNLERRLKELYNTAVPVPFECVYAATVEDAAFVEKQLHNAFADHRVHKDREFFEIAPERVVSALRLAEIEEVTPKNEYVETKEDQKALDMAKERRSAFNFKMVDIPIGSVLTFSRDSDIKCSVVNNKNVKFEGKTTSLSKSALAIFHRMGYEWKTVAGTDYWKYENETLSERRKRITEVEG